MHSIIPPQCDARFPGISSTCFDHRQCGQWLRDDPLASGRTLVPQCSQRNPSFRTCRNLLFALAIANLLECRLRPHQGIGFGLVLASQSQSMRRSGLCSGRAAFTAVPLGSAITSSSDFTTACFIRRSGLRPGFYAFVPVIVRQPPCSTGHLPPVRVSAASPPSRPRQPIGKSERV